MYADGNMTLKLATLKAELLPALLGKMFLRIGFAPCALWVRTNSLKSKMRYKHHYPSSQSSLLA